MANAQHGSGGMIGVNFGERTTTERHKLGTTEEGILNRTYIYVQANGAIAADLTVIAVDSAFQATNTAGAYSNDEAFADNEFGWVFVATTS